MVVPARSISAYREARHQGSSLWNGEGKEPAPYFNGTLRHRRHSLPEDVIGEHRRPFFQPIQL
jgi:hypothetical protein